MPGAVEETKIYSRESARHGDRRPQTNVAEMPDSAEKEEGLSRLKLAIKALDAQFRPAQPLAEAS